MAMVYLSWILTEEMIVDWCGLYLNEMVILNLLNLLSVNSSPYIEEAVHPATSRFAYSGHYQ